MSAEGEPKAPYVTPQVSIRGRNARVVQDLAEGRETGVAEVVAWIVDQWIGSAEGRKRLLDDYDIDVRKYRTPDKIVSITRKKSS